MIYAIKGIVSDRDHTFRFKIIFFRPNAHLFRRSHDRSHVESPDRRHFDVKKTILEGKDGRGMKRKRPSCVCQAIEANQPNRSLAGFENSQGVATSDES